MSLIPLVVADLRQITTAAIANAQRELAAKKARAAGHRHGAAEDRSNRRASTAWP